MMEKWTAPKTVVEQFVANEYVAACGDLNKVYKFTCDAKLEYGRTYFVEDADGRGLGNYHPCSETHEANTTDEFFNGYIYYTTPILGIPTPFGKTPVIIWRGANNKNLHCTTNLDMKSWETDRS